MADTTVKLSGTYDSIEAYNILTEMQTLETTIEGYKTDAETAATNAGTSETNAGNSASAAATSESNASTYAGNALGYANAASASASDASGYATAASNSADAAEEWATKTNDPVYGGNYSAKYYANAAASSASAAAASEAVVAGALPLSGGTMTGTIKYNGANSREFRFELDNGNTNFDIGWNFTNVDGALLGLRSASFNNGGADAGAFVLGARKGSDSSQLVGEPNGDLFWKGVKITDGSFITARIVSTGTNPTNGANVTAPAVTGYQFVCWVMSASQGNIIPSYIQNATSNPGRIWYSGSAAGVYFDCTALYVRKW